MEVGDDGDNTFVMIGVGCPANASWSVVLEEGFIMKHEGDGRRLLKRLLGPGWEIEAD